MPKLNAGTQALVAKGASDKAKMLSSSIGTPASTPVTSQNIFDAVNDLIRRVSDLEREVKALKAKR